MNPETLISLLKNLPHHSKLWEADKWATDRNLYPVYYRLYQALNSLEHISTFYEIGTMMGYGAVTALTALPNLQKLVWTDDESGVPDSNELALANLKHALAVLQTIRGYKHSVEFTPLNGWVHPPTKLDVIHIDGGHDERSVYNDLKNAFKLSPKFIVGHDLTLDAKPFGVKRALDRFCNDYKVQYVSVDLTFGAYVIPLTRSLADTREALVANGVPLLPPTWLQIPKDPWVITTANKNKIALCTIAAGKDGEDLFRESQWSFRKYADKVGADLVEICTPKFPEFPLADKLGLRQLLDYYDRVLYADADVLFTDKCPNLFTTVPNDEVGLAEDGYALRVKTGKFVNWFAREFMSFEASQGRPWNGKLNNYWNTGLILFGQQHRGLFTPPAEPFPVAWCQEQNAINVNLTREKYKVKDLSSKVWSWWASNEAPVLDKVPIPAVLQEAMIKSAWVLHFAGMGHTPEGKANRLKLMREWATI